MNKISEQSKSEVAESLRQMATKGNCHLGALIMKSGQGLSLLPAPRNPVLPATWQCWYCIAGCMSFHDEAHSQVQGSFNQVPETRTSHLAGGFWLWSGMPCDIAQYSPHSGAPTVPKTMG